MSYRILALNWRCLRHPETGGAELNIFEQARSWTADGHEVTLVCADPGREHAPVQDELVDGITVRRMGNRFTVYLWTALFILRYARHFDFVVDVSNGIPFFSPLLTRTPGILLVHHVHGQQWFKEFPGLLAQLGWFLERRVVLWVYRKRRVVAVSPTTREALLSLGFAPQQVQVIYNGVALPREPKRPPEVRMPRIAYVGRVKRYKRLDLLVRAVDKLRHDFPALHLDIAGDGDARPEIEALINELKLQDYVTLYGRVSEAMKAEILRSAVVFATPSMHEGWGLSVIEANAFGCPAVAYDVPGLRVAIRHGETGLLARDDEEFRAALGCVLSDMELRDSLATAARSWAATFDWRATATATLVVLEASANQRPAYLSV